MCLHAAVQVRGGVDRTTQHENGKIFVQLRRACNHVYYLHAGEGTQYHDPVCHRRVGSSAKTTPVAITMKTTRLVAQDFMVIAGLYVRVVTLAYIDTSVTFVKIAHINRTKTTVKAASPMKPS